MTTELRPTKAQAGEIYGSNFDEQIKVTVENLENGRVVALTDSALKVRKFTNNIQTIVFSGDLVTSNVINLDVTNSSGVLTAIAPVTFATDHLTTMGLIGDAIVAINSDISYSVGGGSNRTLTLRCEEGTLISVADVVVTAGAGQATATLANSSDEAIHGISLFDQYEPDSSGNVYCKANGQKRIMRKGKVFVYCKGSFTPASSAYVRTTDGSGDELRGTLRLDSTNAVAVSEIKFMSSGTDELALVEINLP